MSYGLSLLRCNRVNKYDEVIINYAENRMRSCRSVGRPDQIESTLYVLVELSHTLSSVSGSY
jgi:hypothetical protein